MSEYISFEIQVEIIKRVLPVKSLIRFRSVSKQWKSLIDSSEFITHHSIKQTHPHHLLISYCEDSKYKFVSIVDDDSFPLHKISLEDSPSLNLGSNGVGFNEVMFDCSHGLVFLYGESVVLQKNLIILWNPTIRKSVYVEFEYEPYVVGFGVCPKTGDPKILKITNPDRKAEVLTLGSGVWRSISMNLQKRFIKNDFHLNQVVIDGVIHWLSYKGVPGFAYFIVSFDLTSEEFGEIDLPDSIGVGFMLIYKLKESLALLKEIIIDNTIDVWMMIKNGSESSFTKLFTFSFYSGDRLAWHFPIGFRKNGQVIWECRIDSQAPILELYEPCTKHINDLEFGSDKKDFRMIPYTESLVLLNHSDSIIHG